MHFLLRVSAISSRTGSAFKISAGRLLNFSAPFTVLVEDCTFTGGSSGQPPRYRCHLGCILLRTPAIPLRTGAEHFNCVISAAADTPEDESQVESLLAAMEAAGVER